MTRKLGSGVVVIEQQAPQLCKRCNQKKECRDILGNGTAICFQCSTPKERDAYGKRLFGVQ